MTMLEHAYKLLPPPLAALPAKYWTSISLLVHSYSVGVLFQELVEAYSESHSSGNLPEPDYAFIIGFLHDMGQKLGITKKRLENAQRWVIHRLQDIKSVKINEREAVKLSKYMRTNVAETLSDPSYSRTAWRLLQLADRVQGTSNIGDIIGSINEFKMKTGWNVVINYYHIATPHPLIRYMISRIVHKTIMSAVRDGLVEFALPISLAQGLLVLSESPIGKIEFDWDEIRYILRTDALLGDAESERYYQSIKYCKGIGKKKPNKFKGKNCDPLGDFKMSTYEVVLLYYGSKEKAAEIGKEIILPKDVVDQLINIEIEGVRYVSGSYTCPFCGVRTPVGVHVSEIGDIIGGIRAAKEKWTRRFPPVNLNVMLRNPPYLACPLCLGEALLYSRLFAKVKGERVLVGNTYSAPLPVSAAYDLGALLQHLIDKFGNRLIKSEKALSEMFNVAHVEGLPESSTVAVDYFTATIYGIVGLKGEKNIEVTVNGVALAGLLASWGLYPLVMKPDPSPSHTDKLLTFYKGQYPLFDFSPSDKQLEQLTPYVASLMMGMGHLYFRKFVIGESVPATTEVLNYPPCNAPLLLQYASPQLYSHIESLRMELEGGEM